MRSIERRKQSKNRGDHGDYWNCFFAQMIERSTIIHVFWGKEYKPISKSTPYPFWELENMEFWGEQYEALLEILKIL
jgi:hypothetical protein